ncbi:MAG: AAA family ATPase [Bacteroidia bacterium]|nr:AAA family ATPase [Bacteroidia bacterium]
MTNHYDYDKALTWLQNKGKEQYGKQFNIQEEDKALLRKLLCYFLRDVSVASQLNININKGILLTGPVGCGKTTLMSLMRFFQQPQERFILKSCRDVSFEFIQHGYETIHKYSRNSFRSHEPQTLCFDDLGTENNLKYFGNECNVMAEIILSRYDLFVSRKLLTHLTTNLSASEIEEQYGNRVRSRLREMMNLISFEKTTKDKRK